MPESEVLRAAIDFLRSEVSPNAQSIDADPAALGRALHGMCERNLMALKRPIEFGGPALPESEFRQFQQEVARVSGSLAFLQTQHQSAASMIAKSRNEALKRTYLPEMAGGGRLVGIGFSQLRRGGPPIMRATPIDSGYSLEGHVPWVTGWSFFPEFLIGATLPSGEAVFGLVPLVDGPGVSVSSPMRLAAMESAQTVTVDFADFVLDEAKVAFIQPSGWAKANDQINIALQGHFAIGCALAGLDHLRLQAERKALPFIRDALDALTRELDECRSRTNTAHADFSEETTRERLELRAWAIDLAVRCAHAAVAATSGAANSMDNPAQRIYREALVFTVSAQTPEIMEATLQRLTR